MPALLWLALLLGTQGIPTGTAAVALVPGDLVVSGTALGEPTEGLYRVDPVTRAYELLAAGAFPDHAIDPTGAILAIEDDSVVRIDPVTGIKLPVDGGAGLGALAGIAVDRAGSLYLMTASSPEPPYDPEVRVLRLDAADGTVSNLASGGYLSGGSGFSEPLDLELATDGAPLVLKTGVFNSSLASIVRIEPADGSQALLTDASDLLATGVGLGVAPDGALLVTADGRALCDCVALIDPETGSITGGSLRIVVDGVPQGTAIASDIAAGPAGDLWLLAYVGDPIGPGLFRWDVRPQIESDGSPFLPMSAAPLGDVQVVSAVCGDGALSPPEECDDSNSDSGDGCSAGCLAEICGNGRLDSLEECDDGNLESGDGCDANCTVTACGNDVQTLGEECDDGNLASGDGCDANCTLTSCGNGIVTGPESCDDGDAVQDNGCNDRCLVDFGEQTNKQRRCIKAVNQGIDRVAKARWKANERCLADAASGRLGADPGAFDACLDADAQGKVARAQRDLEARERDSCTPDRTPELALDPGDRLAGAPAAATLPSALVRDLFGDPAEAAASTEKAAAKCQQKVLKQADAFFDAIWFELRDAKADKLAGRGSDPAVNDEVLTDHVQQVVAGSRSIAKAAESLGAKTADACAGVPSLATLFAGCEPADPAALASCADRAARCRACLLLVEADPGVALDCDVFDDRADDESCPPSP